MSFKRHFLAFVGGLLLGWLVIGWLVWPVHWVDTKPSELLPDYQKVYVRLVAGDYWRDRNLGLVREALGEWDDRALAVLLEQMMNEAASVDEREQLSALSDVLTLPDVTLSIRDMFFDPNNKLLFLMTGLSVSFLIGAVTLGFSSILKSKSQAQEEAFLQAVDENDQLYKDFELESNDEEELKNRSDANKDEQFEYGKEFEEDGESDTSIDSEDKSDSSTKDSQDENEESNDNQFIDLDDDEEEEESQTSTGALFSFFEEEESIFPELEALCKNLPEVDIDELHQLGKQVVSQFRMGRKEPF